MAVSVFKWLILLKWCFTGVFLMPLQDKAGSGQTQGEKAAAQAGDLHPLYVSVTEISHNPKEKTLEVSCKMFTNDLEATLEKVTHAKVDLSEPKDKTATDKLIAEYVQKHLLLKVDGRLVTLQFVGSEKEAEGTWSYFQVSNVPSVKRIDISNNLLYDNFDKEINIIHVSAGGARKSTKLNYPEVNTFFEF